jgi:hypothetical protein
MGKNVVSETVTIQGNVEAQSDPSAGSGSAEASKKKILSTGSLGRTAQLAVRLLRAVLNQEYCSVLFPLNHAGG